MLTSLAQVAPIEQCECGIWFLSRSMNHRQYRLHLVNGVHERALGVKVCMFCFYSDCESCQGFRSSVWECKCKHDFVQHPTEPKRGFQQFRAFDAYLRAGAPREH